MAAEEFLQDLLKEMEEHMHKSLEATRRELTTIRTGRANPSLLDRIEVEYFGSRLPINQVANISVPEPRMIVVSPWDKKALPALEKAILKSDLGMTPNSDGSVIRLVIPQLTEERRREMTKVVGRKIEEGKVSVRNIRRESIEDLRSLKKEGEIAEDEEKRTEEQVQKVTDRFIYELDVAHRAKEAELMEV
jgi:ribosome recycling factor